MDKEEAKIPLCSNITAYLELRKFGSSKVGEYPESTSPVPIAVKDYIDQCVAGDIDDATHVSILESPSRSNHWVAVAAEEFFTARLNSEMTSVNSIAGII